MKFFSFKGTADRFEWWYVSLVSDVLAQVGLIVGLIHFSGDEFGSKVIGVALMLLALLCIWAALAVTVRRLRDRRRPGWLAVLQLIPYLGWIYLIVECGILASPNARPRGRVVRRQVVAGSDDSK